MKSFTDLFIHRPVLALVVNIVILIAGFSAWQSLSVRQYPRSDNASVSVTTVYVGASAEVVKGFVTTAIERAIASAEGIDYVESKSLTGISIVTARLKLNYEPIKALADITAKVNQVRNELPPEAEVPSINVQSEDSEFAAMYLSCTAQGMSQAELTDYLIRVVQPRLAAVEGVQRAEFFGARTFAMRIWLDPARMAALNISPGDVHGALARNNVLTAAGNTMGEYVEVKLAANTDLRSEEDFRRMAVLQRNDTTVRLADIAEIELGAEEYNTRARSSGEPAIFMGIHALPTANAIEVVQRTRAELQAIQADLPRNVQVVASYDSTEYIQDAIREVTRTLVDTLTIVVVVIFLFLGSARAVIVPVMAIPISLIGGIFLMYLFGFTLNLLTLLAIVLSVGLVVDDAIVVVENVERHLREGRKPVDAALIGARELIGPIIAMTITLVAVYTPIGLQGGLTGSLFREFALTLAGAVIISGIVALTLSPVMCARLFHSAEEEMRGLTGAINRGFDRLRNRYGRLLARTLRARPGMYVLWAVLSLMTLPMYKFSPYELAPLEDQGFMFGIIVNASDASADQKSFYASAAEEKFLAVPEMQQSFQLLFAPNDPFGASLGIGGFSGMVLKPWTERERSVSQILPELQQELNQITGLQILLARPPALPGGGNFPVEFIISATAEPERILEYAQQLQEKAMQSGLFYFPPGIDLQYDQPQSNFRIDFEKAAALGLSSQSISADLGAALGGNFVNRFNLQGRSYKVISQIARSERLNPDQLMDIYVSNPSGDLIPLSTIATFEDVTVPRSLNRFQQLNAIKLSGMTSQQDAALRVLEKAAKDILPAGYSVNYLGESRQLRTEGGKFLPALGLAITMIFLVLAVLFNSFRDPFVILLGSVPLAMFGALVFTTLKMPNADMPFFTDGWTTTLNIYAQVGMVTLVGLVARNGILIVDFANRLQMQGKNKLDAVLEAAQTRLRPLLMTTAATVAGHFPLVLVDGPGSAARNSIGLVLVGGMTIGTLFTLFVLPSLYMLIAKQHSVELDKESVAVTQQTT